MPKKLPSGPRRNRKSQIIAAAQDLLHRNGLVGVTTRAIAAAVPCSEGAIYVHFRSRLDLLLAVVEASLAHMLAPLRALSGQVGSSTPQQNLTRVVNSLQEFHQRVAPVLGSLFAEPELLQGFRATLALRGDGPHVGISSLARYIQAEQDIGRLPKEIDAGYAAATLMSVSFFQGFTHALFGQTAPRFNAKRLVALTLTADS